MRKAGTRMVDPRPDTSKKSVNEATFCVLNHLYGMLKKGIIPTVKFIRAITTQWRYIWRRVQAREGFLEASSLCLFSCWRGAFLTTFSATPEAARMGTRGREGWPGGHGIQQLPLSTS